MKRNYLSVSALKAFRKESESLHPVCEPGSQRVKGDDSGKRGPLLHLGAG